MRNKRALLAAVALSGNLYAIGGMNAVPRSLTSSAPPRQATRPSTCTQEDTSTRTQSKPLMKNIAEDPRRFIELYKRSTSRNSMRHPRPTTRARKRNTAAHTCAVQTMNYHSAGGPRSPESVPRRWHCGPSLWNMERPSLPSLGLPGAAAAPPRAQPPRAADYCAAHGPWRAAQNTHFLVLCVGVTELCFLAFRGFSVAFPWVFRGFFFLGFPRSS